MSTEKVFFEIENELYEEETPAYRLEDLKPSTKILGPSMIIN